MHTIERDNAYYRTRQCILTNATAQVALHTVGDALVVDGRLVHGAGERVRDERAGLIRVHLLVQTTKVRWEDGM
jgi:hypothetical protein